MKVIFHERYHEVYASDPAAGQGRMEAIKKVLDKMDWIEWVEPEPASNEDLLRVHPQEHIRHIETGRPRGDIARLAAGGAIRSALIGAGGDPAFGLIRPPGHHASGNSCWGFCFYNNMSIAIRRLKADRSIRSAFILDFDLHFGDGNVNILDGEKGITIYNPEKSQRTGYIDEVIEVLEKERKNKYDMFAVSAGFDEYEKDWGGNLKTEDYRTLGRLSKEFSDEICGGRRFAILEGGYYLPDFGVNVLAFLEGFKR